MRDNKIIIKTHKKSWFEKFDMESCLAEMLLSGDICYHRIGKGYSDKKYDLVDQFNIGEDEVKEVMVLQVGIFEKRTIIAEIVYKDDFEKHCLEVQDE